VTFAIVLFAKASRGDETVVMVASVLCLVKSRYTYDESNCNCWSASVTETAFARGILTVSASHRGETVPGDINTPVVRFYLQQHPV
jgi:hypothetical protein